MAIAKTMTGSRAKVFIDKGNGPVLVGIFDSISYGENIGVEPVFTLGRKGAHEIVPLSYEPVQVTCSGFRIVGQGVKILPAFPKLQDLLRLDSITITETDRQTGETIATIQGCVPTSHSGGNQAKALSKVSVTYVGIKMEDESGPNEEGDAPTTLP
jgi:hypothetical protein